MRIAMVIGTTVSTMKAESLRGAKLLIVKPADTTGKPLGKPLGEPYVAVDTVSAGRGDLVLVTEYSSARYTGLTRDLPVDAVIVGVIDLLEEGGKLTYRKA